MAGEAPDRPGELTRSTTQHYGSAGKLESSGGVNHLLGLEPLPTEELFMHSG